MDDEEITPKELDEIDQKWAGIRSDAILSLKAKASRFDINEGLKPYNIYSEELPENFTGTDFKDVNDTIKTKTPSWLNAYWTAKTKGKGENAVTVNVFVVDVKYYNLAKAFMKANPMTRFDDMPEGAQYKPETGTWDIIKGKMFTLVKPMIDQALDKWNIQNQKLEYNATDKVKSMTYNGDIYGNPFNDRNPALASFKNGVFDMETGKLLSKDPKYYLTAQHDYNIELSHEPTPETERYIKAILGDAYNLFCEFVGYGFYGSYPINQALFIHGKGGNGKTQLLNWLIKKIYNVENVATIAPQDYSGAGSQFVSADLYGKDVDIVNELRKGMIYNTESFKSQLGDDLITGQLKGGQRFNFTSHATTFVASNFYPQYNDSSEGMADRFIIVETVSPNFRRNRQAWENLNINFKTIEQEKPRFVYQCMLKAIRAIKNGLFTIPESAKKSTKEFLANNDNLGQWLEEYTDQTKINDDRGETVEAAFNSYREYEKKVLSTSVADKLTNMKEFRSQLKTRGYTIDRSYKGWNKNDKRQLSRVIGLKLTATSYINS